MTPGKLTQVQPFSFEERDKEIQQKKMEYVQRVNNFKIILWLHIT